MEKDFYLDQRWLAGYFEKDWFDHVLKQRAIESAFFEFTPFDAKYLYCDHHEKVASFVTQALTVTRAAPSSLLEVGPSLGRGFFELCTQNPSIRSATLVEPSQLLAGGFSRLFGGGTHTYPVLRGNLELSEIPFDSSHIHQAVQHVERSVINLPYENLGKELGAFDLVACFNVLDQCKGPAELVRFLQDRTAPKGVLALSCTYQWSKKHLGTNDAPFRNMNDLFNTGWKLLAETDIGFRCRVYERHWLSFLSQFSIFQRAS